MAHLGIERVFLFRPMQSDRRNRAVLFSDSLEQLRGTAGARQVTVRADTALAGCNTPDSCGFLMLSKSPS